MKKVVSKSIEDTAQVAKDVLHDASLGKSAKVLALSGDLGSGKTAFVKEMASLLGIEKASVTSPTFVIMKMYKLSPTKLNKKFEHLIHIDAYRLESDDELKHLGWDEILNNPKNLILIEWPEMVPACIPENAQKILFRFVDENTREIEVGESKE